MAGRSQKIQNIIMRWFRRNGRVLPWRATTNPWFILVSELMLQQTQVNRVREKYEEFVAMWPRPSDFAIEPLARVLRFWSGLGYNRRAKHLWQAAQMICKNFADNVPLDEKLLCTLPGVGEYTARAVLSFAGNKNVVCVDTNIRRIFLRVLWGGEFAHTLPSQDELERVLASLLPLQKSRAWHNALMDFGSLVCTSRDPRCVECPLLAMCKSGAKFIAGTATTQKLYRPQERFMGSRRQVRGTILQMLTACRTGRVPFRAILPLGKKFPDHDLRDIIQEMTQEGLLVTQDTHIALPD